MRSRSRGTGGSVLFRERLRHFPPVKAYRPAVRAVRVVRAQIDRHGSVGRTVMRRGQTADVLNPWSVLAAERVRFGRVAFADKARLWHFFRRGKVHGFAWWVVVVLVVLVLVFNQFFGNLFIV